MKDFKNTSELIGAYIQSSWNGMSDFYQVVGSSPKSIILQEVNWVTEADPNGDPTYRQAKMDFIDGQPNYIGKLKRCMVATNSDGTLRIKKSPNYNGCGTVKVCALNNEEAQKVRVSQYWG